MRSRLDAPMPGSAGAAAWVARATFAEAVRMRLAWAIAAVAMLLLAAAVWLRSLHFGAAEIRFLLDLGFSGIGLAAMLLAVVGMAHLYFSDLDSRLATFALARPVARTAWVIGKSAGMLASLAWFCGLLGVLLAVLVTRRATAVSVAVPWMLVFTGVAGLWLKAAIAAAATLFFCTYARTALFASGAGVFFVVVGHLRPVAAEIPLRFDVQGILGVIARLWPDLTRFDPAAAPQPAVATTVHGLGYVILLVGAAAIAFRRRDL